MNTTHRTHHSAACGLTIATAMLAIISTHSAIAQSAAVPPSITSPDEVDTVIGSLKFTDGQPTEDTLEKVYDYVDFTHATRAFSDTLQGVSIHAIRKGLQEIGVKDNEVIVFSELMDANSLFLTANADTVYIIGGFDLSKGPVVIETPPQVLGTVQDAWFRWVIDVGLPGPDRGEGGKYLIVPPGYEGALPEGGFNVAFSKTTHGVWFARAFIENNNDPKPVVARIKELTKIYPYTPGSFGTPIAEFLDGKAPLGKITDPPATVFHEGSGKVMNTIPPNDWTYYEMLNEVIQQEPATSLDPELMGPIAAIGIVKGKPFTPDERMKKILTEALVVANAASRSIFMAPRDPSWYYYGGDSNWQNMLFATGYEFETPIPMITKDGVKPFPTTGYRQLDARRAFFYGVTGITPAMAMRLPGIGSTYLWTMVDSDKNYFDGSKTYKVTLPKDIPAGKFWSFTLYDTMTRSMLATPQRYPRAGSQSYPSPAATSASDGTTTLYFSPEQPEGVERGNWIQTLPGKGFFPALRLYSPLEPFFDKQWQPTEVELVK
ncbi:DUF1254 domain-containing protein [Adhaeretor mobilis]|uniref:DUF1254 domain-containing protein n=1 Tax=Adhaeretor mobilis TaxID=1930276 RepID=A0A517N1B1_9BACT|nr:DUF1254 domain-containing protein [Adhaeretor mobilis]QDT00930.1 hypothetical protein HG15A2_42720 [Adhaeretor mobilis]